MALKEISFPVSPDFRQKAFSWTQTFPFAYYQNGHQYKLPYGPFEEILAIGTSSQINENQSFWKSKADLDSNKTYFGFLSYDAGLENFGLEKRAHSKSEFPEYCIFEAITVLIFEKEIVSIKAEDPEKIFQSIQTCIPFRKKAFSKTEFKALESREKYLQNVNKIQDLIREGRVYEANYCQFLEAQTAPCGLSFYLSMQEIMPMPFSAWLKFPNFEIASASPERFLKKDDQTLVSQPIKGTAKRGKTQAEDESKRRILLNSEKERAENLMIVDLVRNDLASVSEIGSTKVQELFGIYGYPSVFQMISTIQSQMREDLNWRDALKALFPMGSMTGAPKKEVMHHIQSLESKSRGPFSGCLGWISGQGNFDLNVLIRSLFIDHKRQKSFFGVGSAITIDAEAEVEWKECALKAKKILELFGQSWESAF